MIQQLYIELVVVGALEVDSRMLTDLVRSHSDWNNWYTGPDREDYRTAYCQQDIDVLDGWGE